jgi:hypothetical protein
MLVVFCIFFLFCKFSFSVEVIASKPFRDPGCQYQRPFSGLGYLFVVLSWLLYISVTCLSLAHGYPHVVVAQHTLAHVLSW